VATPQKVLAKVSSVDRFGGDTYQVTMAVAKRYTKFTPGQFLHLALDHYDPTGGFWPESRVFSIASPPGCEHVTVVYSVKGAYTRRMEKELVVGREVWLKLPYGSFVIGNETQKTRTVTLIAGGTGISPFVPFLSRPEPRVADVALFYGVRSPDLVLFRDTLRMVSRDQGTKLYLISESGADPEFPSRTGRLSISLVKETLRDRFPSSVFYLSGPPAMIRAFRTDLVAAAIPQDCIHIDEWE